jgi:pimeloyl-ACP methyl ester carboxylesterase
MLGQLVDIQTPDGIKLHGFLLGSNPDREWIWIIVHGVNGNFYSSTLLGELGQSLLRLGADALLINTRGHDLATFGSADYPARMGSMFETIADGRIDIAAWIRFCKQEGYKNIGCIAHSLGAVKVSFALSQSVDPVNPSEYSKIDLDRFVALSPPRLNTKLLLNDPTKREVFEQHLQEAHRWCDQGFPHHIMRIRFPLANWVSAETFLDKYGSGDRYDYFAYWSGITVPTFWIFGEQEVRQGSVNFRDVDQQLELAIRDTDSPNHQLSVIPKADHSYRGEREALIEAIYAWVRCWA